MPNWKQTYRNMLANMKDSEGRYRVKSDNPEAAMNVVYAMYRYYGGKQKRDAFAKEIRA